MGEGLWMLIKGLQGLAKGKKGPLPLLITSGIFSWSGAMGSGPVKGFNSPEEDGELATFAAGCFWGVQLAFQRVPGVASTMVGYTAGPKQHPTYNEVCSGSTGHTEAVQMLFNPDLVTYKEL